MTEESKLEGSKVRREGTKENKRRRRKEKPDT